LVVRLYKAAADAMAQRATTRGLRVHASMGSSDAAEQLSEPSRESRRGLQKDCCDMAQLDALLRRHRDFVVGRMERWMADHDSTLQRLLDLQTQPKGGRLQRDRQKKDHQPRSVSFVDEAPSDGDAVVGDVATSEATGVLQPAPSSPVHLLEVNGVLQPDTSAALQVDAKFSRRRSTGSLELLREEEAIRYATSSRPTGQPRRSTKTRLILQQARLQTGKPLRSVVRSIVRTNYFEIFFAAAIMLNSLMIGVEVDWSAGHPKSPVPFPFYVLQIIFTLVFSLEFLLRITADGVLHYFCSKDWLWNWFDALILISCIFEAFIMTISWSSASEYDSMDKLSVIRMLRITRVLRTFRATRAIRVFSALRTLVFSIIHTLKSLVWAMVLLVMDMYLYGIVFTEAGADYIARGSGEYEDEMHEFWGSLITSIFTLFKSISGGLSWHDAVRPISSVHPVLVVFFATYIAFTYFAVLNVVTGFFCHSAIETAERDPDMIAHRLMERRQDYSDKLRKLFNAVDTDCSGEITVEELEQLLTDKSLQANFEALGIDTQDAWTLFKLFDKDRTNSIEVDEFIEGCIRLKGSAKGIDVAKLADDHRFMMKRQLVFMRSVQDQLGLLKGSMGALEKGLAEVERGLAEVPNNVPQNPEAVRKSQLV